MAAFLLSLWLFLVLHTGTFIFFFLRKFVFMRPSSRLTGKPGRQVAASSPLELQKQLDAIRHTVGCQPTELLNITARSVNLPPDFHERRERFGARGLSDPGGSRADEDAPPPPPASCELESSNGTARSCPIVEGEGGDTEGSMIDPCAASRMFATAVCLAAALAGSIGVVDAVDANGAAEVVWAKRASVKAACSRA